MSSTIKDVARCAGVSIATVSHVINKTKVVLPETEARVLKAIEELNYAPNQTAKSFKTGKKNIIAFIVPDISNNYFANIIESLESEIGAYGYSLILANTKEKKENEIHQLKYMTSGIVDGIVLASTVQEFSEIQVYIPDSFPVVLIDRRVEDCPYDCICVSDAMAVSMGMKTLLEKGHRKIGYIGDLQYLSTAQERERAYCDSLEKYGIPVEPDLILHATSLNHDAYELTGMLLKKGCSAVVAGNNLMTVDAYCYLTNHKAEYPDASVFGYQHKELSHLFLSDVGVIVQNEMEMGIAAGQQIISRIRDPKAPRREIIISNQYLPPLE